MAGNDERKREEARILAMAEGNEMDSKSNWSLAVVVNVRRVCRIKRVEREKKRGEMGGKEP
ncbi:hypothetical protein L484_007903 [Morus notabilis]|uniref:Uncharacterized protein n=1 Tax=Morus notabilis TaxID=981085 RepID=W9R330_9ROSA|nr:hypothetical protein L484_007903 [Morus notabilis]